MAAPKGNEFWKLRTKHGRDKLFSTPELLWEEATKYFEWCVNNPLQEEKVFHYQGSIVKTNVNKMRAFTLSGLATYLDCSEEYLRNFEQNNKDAKDFMSVITRIKETIWNQKFSGAASELLNPSIIAMELGLKSKQEIEQTNYNHTPLSEEEIKKAQEDIDNAI